MSIDENVRTAPADEAVGEGVGALSPGGWLYALLLGALTAALSAAVVVLPTLMSWSSAGSAPGSRDAALRVGAALWLLAGGAHLTFASFTISVVPLLGLAVLVAVAHQGAREAIRGADDGEAAWADLIGWSVAAAAGSWLLGYAAVVGGAAYLARDGMFGLSYPSLAMPMILVPLLAMVLAVSSLERSAPGVLGEAWSRLPVPFLLRAAIRPALRTALTLVMLGSLGALMSLATNWDDVRSVNDALGASGVGTGALIAAQLSVLPNAGLWVVSFLAGSGFVVADASVSWQGATAGNVPLVPALAALPRPGAFPGWVPVACVSAMVAVGIILGNRMLAAIPRLSSPRTKAYAAIVAACVTGCLLALFDAIGGGALGEFRLASVGAPALRLGLFSAAQLAGGALIAVALDAWKMRR